MPGGRPTHYDQSIVDASEHYIENWEDAGAAIPSVVTLCRVINRARSTVYQWAEGDEHPEFTDILSRINELQEETSLTKGLTKEHDSGITKLVLGKHGYKEMRENSGDPEEKQTLEEINARIGKLLSREDPE